MLVGENTSMSPKSGLVMKLTSNTCRTYSSFTETITASPNIPLFSTSASHITAYASFSQLEVTGEYEASFMVADYNTWSDNETEGTICNS